MTTYLDFPHRYLFGPGPTNASPSVLEAAGLPLIGHLDPVFSDILEDLCTGLRALFGTSNQVTFAASATGSAGMELLAMNLVEPGDTVLIGVNGVFGNRMTEACEKLGATVIQAKAAWGEAISLDVLKDAAGDAQIDIVWLVHAETSTGVHQCDLAEIGEWVHSQGALFFLDTVTSLGGLPVELDAWGVDAAFSGSQKCLSVTPGLAPVSIGTRALAKFEQRKTPVPSWYFDLAKLLQYWQVKDGRRAYHHTAPIAPLLALHQSVTDILTEGLNQVYARHTEVGDFVMTELQARGFEYVVQTPAERLPMLHCVRVPEGVDEAQLRQRLLQDHNVEIGSGLGAFAGTAVRIGVMGYNANIERVTYLLNALDQVLETI